MPVLLVQLADVRPKTAMSILKINDEMYFIFSIIGGFV